jgi:hypothetical protein
MGHARVVDTMRLGRELLPRTAIAVMKSLTSLIGVITTAMCFSASSHAEFKFISMLRGEPKAPSFQRVAFLGSASVRDIQGQAERLCGIDRWSPIDKGTQLHPGDVIRALSGSVVLKMDRTDSYVRINPNTVLRLVPDDSPRKPGTVFASTAR